MKGKTDRSTEGKSTTNKDRKARLAAELRANLMKRKAQARQREQLAQKPKNKR